MTIHHPLHGMSEDDGLGPPLRGPFLNIDINRAINENRPYYFVDYYSLATIIRDMADADAAAEALREWKLRTGAAYPYHPSCPSNKYGG